MHSAVSNPLKCSGQVIVKLFLAGARLDERNVNRETPLHSAVRADNIAAIEMLIKLGADVNAYNGQYITPKNLALQSTQREALVSMFEAS